MYHSMKQFLKYLAVSLGSVLLTSLMWYSVGSSTSFSEELPIDNIQVYEQKDYVFEYPLGVRVTQTQDMEDPQTKYLYLHEDATGEVPVMQITVRPRSSVEFSLWEGIGWEHFQEVMHSFRFIHPAQPGVDPHEPCALGNGEPCE